MGKRTRTSSAESGFTLAGLIVILTIIAVFIAYTVPEQWSKIMQRERERQTIFVMKQYARTIHEWQAKHGGGFPTSMDQIKEARLPRMVRGPKGELLDPLTGKAIISYNNAANYEEWFYTVYELNAEIQNRIKPSPYK